MEKYFGAIDIKVRTLPVILRQFQATVKPVCNDHLYNKIYYLWFIH